MKLPKDNPKVKKIVDVASQSINQGLEEARHLLEKSEAEGGILANLAHLAKKRKKEPKTDTFGIHVDRQMDTPLRIVVLGGGSFGTAMANLSAKNGCETTLWVRDRKTVKALQKTRINKKYLPNHVLDSRLAFSHDLAESVKNKDIIFVAVPSSAVRETLQKIRPHITHQAVVSLTKGIEKGTFALMSDIIKDELPQVNFGVMSGPNLALEIMNNMPSASVIASLSEPLRVAVQTALHSAFFRVFASDDVKGVELGGALKNIYAVAMGMANAYGVGENTKAMLLTRALAEMSRFGVAVGANPLTFLGLSGVGDLYATCNSTLSRNYQIGNMLGKGITLDNAIKKLGQTAEGVNTIAQVEEQAKKLGIYMPITHALYAVLYENKSALSVAVNLMETGFRSDVEFVMPHDESNEKLSKEFDKVLKASKENKPKDDEAIDDKDDK
ncbi:Glycerol-3-phosphate dehydrogenase [NAD(P)+] [Moraxella lacunata]|uniref:Glycerol-3-phosphate dehydrogenase [NAD(P)+] n=1 Tax=Moraxella lacunata TaxID=477 RepID=A0A378T468_MORLA|nr:NAD(P)H-dependent glycerol-3-phosphate dehydrogenase [Moraxella lacunata]STZ55628.1 Glycerol-3-phosphate dehydrogenase [NAD(P)+] [Moraxella lacunata]